MGFFDRMMNLGRGKLRVHKSSQEDVLSDAELAAELSNVRPAPRAASPVPTSSAVPTHETATEPEPEEGPDGPELDADGKIIKTL